VEAAGWGIKKMKTRWGSCNTASRRIWLNLELAKKPPECLEYLVVHELVHLLVRHHDERFNALMDRHLPRWRQARRTLNAAPLAHETWEY
jgi:predicted metal-dependent hydrolase